MATKLDRTKKTVQTVKTKGTRKMVVQMIPVSAVLPLFEELPEGYRLASFIEKSGRTEANRYDVNIIVTRENVGYALVKKVKGKVFLDGIYVLPAHRNKGIATYLLKTVLLNHQNADLFVIPKPYKDKSVRKEDLIEWYKRFGFEEGEEGKMVKGSSK